jgi:hypothetical protein
VRWNGASTAFGHAAGTAFGHAAGTAFGHAAGTAVLVLAGTLATAAPARASANPLEEARRAAGRTSFVGVMTVRWQDGAKTRVERVSVQADGGALVFRGGTQVMAAPTSERLVQHGGGSWDLLWPAGLGPGSRPDLAAKYAVVDRPGPTIAGQPTVEYDVSSDGRVRERLHLHAVTSLLLSREQFDDNGNPVRSVGFEALTLEPSSPAVPPAPTDLERHVPREVRASAQAGLGDGYQRLGVYRRSGVVQSLYSDGLYDLSVFQQRGRLRRDDLPSGGARVEVGGSEGWRYTWPGGNLVVWQGGDSVFTAVSDAPLDQVLVAARSVPRPSRGASFWYKLRAACATLVQPLDA